METKKIILIILVVILLGPFVFMGACAASVTFVAGFDIGGRFGVILTYALAIVLTILALIWVIRRDITNKKPKNPEEI